MNEFEKFKKWREETIYGIKEWPERLCIAALQEAYGKKLTYDQAKNILLSHKNELPDEFHASAAEVFDSGVIRAIIDDARRLINKKEGKIIVSTPPVSDRDGKKSKKRD